VKYVCIDTGLAGVDRKAIPQGGIVMDGADIIPSMDVYDTNVVYKTLCDIKSELYGDRGIRAATS
jgi:hypothetical protein